MGFVKEFKEFAVKGNVMDMAVGVIIGGAFGKIVTSLVNDIMMPLISKITGGINFTDLKIVLTPADEANKVAEVAFAYGNFIQNVFDFLIIAITTDFSSFVIIFSFSYLLDCFCIYSYTGAHST